MPRTASGGSAPAGRAATFGAEGALPASTRLVGVVFSYQAGRVIIYPSRQRWRKQRSESSSPGFRVMIMASPSSLALSMTSWSLTEPRG